MAAVPEIKLCLLGNSGVGKTCVVLRYLFDTFNENTDRTPSTGVSHFTKQMKISGIAFKYCIWDTAGEEKYRSLAPLYYRDSTVAIIAYDITSQKSYDSVASWITEIRQSSVKIAVIALVGTKSDLTHRRQIDAIDARNFAAELDLLFFETSSKDGTNISRLFDAISERLLKLGLLKPGTAQSVDNTVRLTAAADTSSSMSTSAISSSCCFGRGQTEEKSL